MLSIFLLKQAKFSAGLVVIQKKSTNKLIGLPSFKPVLKTHRIEYQANPSTSARTAAISARNNKDFYHIGEIKQAGRDKPTLSIANYQTGAIISLPPAAGSQTFSISISSGWDWTAFTQANWLRVSDDQSTDVLTISYDASSLSSTRDAVVDVQVKDFTSEHISLTFRQAAKPTLSIANYQTGAIISLPPAAGSQTFSVSISSGWDWTSSTQANWLRVSDDQSTDMLTISYDASSLSSTRDAVVDVQVKDFTSEHISLTFRQAAKPTLSIANYQTGAIISLPPAAGSQTFSISISSGWDWTASTQANWLRVSDDQSTDVLTISYDASSLSSTRDAVVDVQVKDFTSEHISLTFRQASARVLPDLICVYRSSDDFIIIPGSMVNLSAVKGDTLFDVALLSGGSPVQGEWTFSKPGNTHWFSLSQTQDGSKLRITFEKNSSGTTRRATIHVASKDAPNVSQTVVLSQISARVLPDLICVYRSSDDFIIIPGGMVNLSAVKGDTLFDVALLSGGSPVQGEWTFSKPGNTHWFSLSQTQDGSKLSITFEKNSSGTTRRATIHVASKDAPNVSQTVVLSQISAPMPAAVTIVLPSASGGSYPFNVEGTHPPMEWRMQNSTSYTYTSWYTLDANYVDNVLTIDYEANTTGEKRVASIIITIHTTDEGTVQRRIQIEQNSLQLPDFICVYKNNVTVPQNGFIYLSSDTSEVEYVATLAAYFDGELRGIDGEWVVEGDTPNDWFALIANHRDKKLTIKYQVNNSGSARIARIVVRSKFFSTMSQVIYLYQP